MDISQLLDVIRKLKDDNTDIKECLDFMQMWYRDILMYKTTKDLNLLIFKDEFSAVKKAASLSSYEGLERILEAIDKARVRLDANVNMNCHGASASDYERELKLFLSILSKRK